MYDAAAEIGIAAFFAQDEGMSGARALLEERGIAPWLAQRLSLFLPLAFGRRVFEDAVTPCATIVSGPSEYRLDDDPVWRAAQARANASHQDEIQTIGLQSAEVAAINKALHAGSQLEDLELAPVALVEPLLPLEAGHGGAPSPYVAFVEFLRAHGFAVDATGHVGSLRIAAHYFPRFIQHGVQIQVDFLAGDSRLAARFVNESFGGVGATWGDMLSNVIQRFERGTLHVLIAALLDSKSCADQVMWEPLHFPGGTFNACIGAQLNLYSDYPMPILRSVLDGAFQALARSNLLPAVHSLRFYACLVNGELTAEALLDNETWPAGEALLAAWPWPRVPGMTGVRLFLLLVPESGSS